MYFSTIKINSASICFFWCQIKKLLDKNLNNKVRFEREIKVFIFIGKTLKYVDWEVLKMKKYFSNKQSWVVDYLSCRTGEAGRAGRVMIWLMWTLVNVMENINCYDLMLTKLTPAILLGGSLLSMVGRHFIHFVIISP